ncbi:two-component system response regulator DcuR [Anaerobacillus arseniciselenatis]|uniref:Two-component system response regulator DcuR n=1 Tax=Anaerobacillus arseniciselenatis TaxID=85682 RepID=A0A1S2LA30_9BACI|nr:response regulator [Anaerobacillus arseniciselenatis]OIJ09342.1 two-component system response regulator DcuR [Anaerobacillus arseniciselenatis]
MIKVLILEDDPMVAELNKRYLQEIEGFELVAVARSFNEAQVVIKSQQIDLLLLDIYMAGKNGLQLLQHIRKENKCSIDCILVTAADDVESIQTALRYGAVDYIIKPFEFERFNQALTNYKEKYYLLKNQKSLKQEELDRNFLMQNEKKHMSLPKGLTSNTLKVIVEAILEKNEEAFSTDEIAEQVQVSRVSVRKYIKYLLEIGVLGERMTYGAIGRPVYLYINRDLSKSTFQNLF